MLRDLRLAVRIGWLRRRFELVALAYAFVPSSGRLFRLGERMLLGTIDLEQERAARRMLR